MTNGLETSGFAEFDRFGLVFRRTRALLDILLARGDLHDGGTAGLANESLPHVEVVEAGCREGLGAGAADLVELRQLILHAGIGPPSPARPAEKRAALIEAMRAMSGGRSQIHPPTARRLAALEHARLVFAFLPATPPEEVHYPAGLRTYADIAPPRTPGELAMRIEEIERELWRLATGRAPRRGDPAYRRTYGFFDAAERLTNEGLHPGS